MRQGDGPSVFARQGDGKIGMKFTKAKKVRECDMCGRNQQDNRTVPLSLRRQGTSACRRLGVLLLLGALLWTLSACGSHAPEFPPAAETIQAAAEKVGWALDPKGTRSEREDQVIYTFETGDEVRASFSCTLAEGNRILMGYCMAIFLPDKPEFSWEDWKKAVTLAETLYGLDEGELYQALSEQTIPEPKIPPAGSSPLTGKESLGWEAELPSGYGRAQWSISAGEVEHGFPEPTIRNWRATFSVSLYESKDAYKSMIK